MDILRTQVQHTSQKCFFDITPTGGKATLQASCAASKRLVYIVDPETTVYTREAGVLETQRAQTLPH